MADDKAALKRCQVAGIKGFLKELFDNIIADDVASLAAAVAYYTTLSLAPIILLALTLAGALYPSAQENLIREIGSLVGKEGQDLVRAVVESASDRPDLTSIAGWSSGIVLLIGASAVLAQMQYSLNRIWDFEIRAQVGVWAFIRRRILSVGVLLSVLFLTIVSLVLQAALTLLPIPGEGALHLLTWVVNLLAYTLMFAALFRWLPELRIPWRTALRGGALTAILFFLGRFLIAQYLLRSDAGAAFGAGGAVIVWLVWAFYSAMILFISAEIMYVMSRRRNWPWVDSVKQEGKLEVLEKPRKLKIPSTLVRRGSPLDRWQDAAKNAHGKAYGWWRARPYKIMAAASLLGFGLGKWRKRTVTVPQVATPA